jgi:Rho GTPase-activating protein RGD1
LYNEPPQLTQCKIGVNTLLNRLKQSIASARDYADFLKKRSKIEEDHAQGLRKLAKIQHDTIGRADSRQGSYAHNLVEMTRIQDRMAENGIQFALSLHQMHEDLVELATNMERGRKHWKQTGLANEKRVQDSINLMEKAKAKYDSLADDYDRARTGDRQQGKILTLKGPKNGARYEEDVHKKLQAADADYQGKVNTAKGHRQELLSAQRPQAIKALQDLIAECDSGLTLQLQKFASFNEKLLLTNGVQVVPVKGQSNGKPEPHGLRDTIYLIDNQKDFESFIIGHSSKVPPAIPEIQYRRHPSLAPQQQGPPPINSSVGGRQSLSGPSGPQQGPPPSFPSQGPGQQPLGQSPQQQYPPGRGPLHLVDPSPTQSSPGGQSPMAGPGGHQPRQASIDRGFGGPPPNQLNSPMSAMQSPGGQYGPPSSQNFPPASGAPQLSAPPQLAPINFGGGSLQTQSQTPQPPQLTQPPQSQYHNPSIPPSANEISRGQASFGVDLDELFKRDGTAVPIVVIQCLQAVDLFGLDHEGIYRMSGTSSHVQTLKGLFDHGKASNRSSIRP